METSCCLQKGIDWKRSLTILTQVLVQMSQIVLAHHFALHSAHNYGVKVFFFSKSVLQGPKSWHEIFVSLSILTLTPDLMFNCSCSWPVPKYRLFCSLHLFGPCTFPFLRKSIILFRFAMHYTQDFSSVKELRPLEGFQAIQEMKISQMILTRQSVRKLPTKVLSSCFQGCSSQPFREGWRKGKKVLNYLNLGHSWKKVHVYHSTSRGMCISYVQKHFRKTYGCFCLACFY